MQLATLAVQGGAAMREGPTTDKAVRAPLRRQRERRLEAPPVLLQEAMGKAARPLELQAPAQQVTATREELLLPLVVNPTLARLLRELGLAPERMLVQELLPTTTPTIPAASGPAPGEKTGRVAMKRS